MTTIDWSTGVAKEVLAHVEQAFNDWKKAESTVRRCKLPGSLACARAEAKRAEARYRAAAAARDEFRDAVLNEAAS